MALHRRGKTTRQIAEAVYDLKPNCMAKTIDKYMAYVRVVVRQRKGEGRSEHDIRYMENGGRDLQNNSRRDRYASDPAFRERRLDAFRKWKGANREHLLAYARWYHANVRQPKRVAKRNESRHIG
jgi:hypothetical protein